VSPDVERHWAIAYLALFISAIGWVLQGALQSTLVVAAAQQLPYLLCSVLDIGGRYGRDGGSERG